MPIIAIVPALLLLGGAGATQGSVTLKFHPPVGKSYHYQMSMISSTEMGKSASPMGMNTQMDINMKVVSRTGDITSLETRMSNMKMNGAGASAVQGAMEKKMSGMVVKTQVDGQYRTKSVNGSSMDSMLSGFSGVTFPNHPVKIGDTWNSNLDLGKALGGMTGSMPGMKINGNIPIHIRLSGFSHGGGRAQAEIHFTMKGDVTMSMSAGPNGKPMNMKMSMDGSGTNLVELATGMPTTSKSIIAMTMEVGGMHLVQHMTQNMNLK
jgi:hypothetical protein